MCQSYRYAKRAGYGHRKDHGSWGHYSHSFFRKGYPPVNLLEYDDRYELFLVAPGRSREDFRLTVKDEVLTITGHRPENHAGEPTWSRQEYRLESFERKFLLNKHIDHEGISARYAEGILQVTMPKVPGADAPDQEIRVGG